jgi:peptidoglycan/xylan/chitin deacetylase (PgdA/CDA1 family)
MAWRETDVGCAMVRLPETWDEYLRMLQPRFRTKVRSVLRNLEGRPEVRFRFCEDAGELERVLPSLFDLHTRRWAEEGKRGVFYWDRKRRFYFELSRVLLDRGWLRLSLLEWNGRILACQYGFAYNGTYFQLQEGYEPASEHWNLGIGLRAWSIREFLKQGLREYDFLGGVGRHKTTWAAEINLSKRIVIASKSYRNLMFRRGPEWDAAGRELVRKVVPEKVLAARRARLENTSAANSGGNTEWVRRAAAACYFHSGLPSVARHLRERYQLSITTNGHGRKISWGPRQEGSARILYYHRINDENDPFFDATPTALFEAHMRYLARHYKVVSAGELMRCLEEGCEPAESVVAITFDDGYEDNYRNAFPILRRYGLPATIFLTTGTIDSGEPLWFEELAEAVKTTAQEYIDVEADVPRRFWLRSQVERIAASGQIFGVLRRLEDGARRERLAGILRELGFQRGARRSAMLTWDQIREMQANGIDFGGHTVTHPFLSKLTPAQASWEISECKRRIEEQIQQPADYFAYPNGREEDFTPENKELLRAAGYRGAMTTIWGLNGRSTDRMELRRGGPWEPSGALFAWKLDWYQLVNQ